MPQTEDKPKLSYITRGNSSPDRKNKVYFAAHPEDFELFFDVITEDILSIDNCAIWYLPKGTDISQDELEELLGQMNLFVIPVSRKLFSTSSSALDVEFPLAMKLHIPVLPIAMENGMRELVELRMGKIQYINRASTDLTAIPYNEKLKAFLSTQFASEKKREMIQKAFDAHIFLSYRKKDRKYAKQLMQLIHSDEKLLSVAIWYDEFLIPGENFSDAIERALKESNLFLLTVTPNLLQENNYIMRIEYPMAKDTGKRILPVEMVSTDYESLREKYSEIAEPINEKNEDRIRKEMADYLSIATETKKKDTMHTFLVGLAYLDGIEVEVNKSIASELITKSAEAGLVDAMEKLSHMYFYGDGVEIDNEKALEWLRKSVEHYGEKAEKTMSEEDIFHFLEKQTDYAEKAYAIHDNEKALRAFSNVYDVSKTMCFGAFGKNIFKKVSVFVKKYAGKSPYYEDSMFFLVHSCRMVFTIFEECGAGEYEEWMKKAQLIVQTGAWQFDTGRFMIEKIALCMKMAKLCYQSGNTEGAEQWFSKADEAWNQYPDEQYDKNARVERAKNYETEAEYYLQQSKFQESFREQEKAFKIYESLHGEFPDDDEIKIMMLKSRLKLGDICCRGGDLHSAIKNSDIVDDLVKDEEKDIFLEVKAASQALKGDVFAGSPSGSSIGYYRNAFDILSEMEEKQIFVSDKIFVPLLCMKMADCCMGRKPSAEIFEWLDKARIRMEDMMFLSKSVYNARNLALCYEKLMILSLKEGINHKAKEWFDKAEFTRKGTMDSTKMPEDAKSYEELIRYRKEVNDRYYSGDESDELLLPYLTGNEDLKKREYNREKMESCLRPLVDDFMNTHPGIDRDVLWKLSGLLKSGEDYFVEAGKVTDLLLKNYRPFLKYDENAAIILTYCGLYNLAQAKRVIGGKQNAMHDFNNYRNDIHFWRVPKEEIKNLPAWEELYLYLRQELNPQA